LPRRILPEDIREKSEKRRMRKKDTCRKESGYYGKEPAEVKKGITDVMGF
jgi:hypothetical protein